MTEFAQFPLVRDALASSQPDKSVPVSGEDGMISPAYHSFDTLGRLEGVEQANSAHSAVQREVVTGDAFAGLQPTSPRTPSVAPSAHSNAVERSIPLQPAPATRKAPMMNGRGESVAEDVTTAWRHRPLTNLFAFLRDDATGTRATERSLRDIFG